MRFLTLAAAVLALAAAGCDDAREAPRAKAPGTASAGAGASPAPTTREPLPAPPQPRASGDEKPDPGDANDHSSPKHDARQKSKGD